MHGVPARSPFDVAVQAAVLDAVLPTADLADPQAFADTIRVSVAAFTAHARNHSDYVRSTTADRLNSHGHATTVRTRSETESRSVYRRPTSKCLRPDDAARTSPPGAVHAL
jgi:hypothetical protein